MNFQKLVVYNKKKGMLENLFVREQKNWEFDTKTQLHCCNISLQNFTVCFNIIQLQGVICPVLYMLQNLNMTNNNVS
jgi:hypothetical protein